MVFIYSRKGSCLQLALLLSSTQSAAALLQKLMGAQLTTALDKSSRLPGHERIEVHMILFTGLFRLYVVSLRRMRLTRTAMTIEPFEASSSTVETDFLQSRLPLLPGLL
jgi:hypothetical protein